MADIDNQTGAPHFWFEQLGPQGERLDVLVVRATFDFATDGGRLTLAERQQDIAFGDSYAGPVENEPLRAVIAEDGDLLPYKPGTDVVVVGHATAPHGQPTHCWTAGISVGKLQKRLRLHGPREFRKSVFGWKLVATEAVNRVPLDYRLSYGGCIDIPAALMHDGSPSTLEYGANPAGCGWLPTVSELKHLPKPARQHVAKWIKAQSTVQAPQIDGPGESRSAPTKPASVSGLGPVARWWAPRVSKQGTYDEQWRKTRYPLLPEDFDSAYYQCAPADMVCTPHLNGDEAVTLYGLLPEERKMQLPGWRVVAVATRASGNATVTFLLLDTVRFHLDVQQASLVWRAHFDDDDAVISIALGATMARFERDDLPHPDGDDGGAAL